MLPLPYEVIDIRSCRDVTPERFTVVDLRDAPGLLTYSVRFDTMDVFEQSAVLDAWYSTNWDLIPEIPFCVIMAWRDGND